MSSESCAGCRADITNEPQVHLCESCWEKQQNAFYRGVETASALPCEHELAARGLLPREEEARSLAQRALAWRVLGMHERWGGCLPSDEWNELVRLAKMTAPNEVAAGLASAPSPTPVGEGPVATSFDAVRLERIACAALCKGYAEALESTDRVGDAFVAKSCAGLIEARGSGVRAANPETGASSHVPCPKNCSGGGGLVLACRVCGTDMRATRVEVAAAEPGAPSPHPAAGSAVATSAHVVPRCTFVKGERQCGLPADHPREGYYDGHELGPGAVYPLPEEPWCVDGRPIAIDEDDPDAQGWTVNGRPVAPRDVDHGDEAENPWTVGGAPIPELPSRRHVDHRACIAKIEAVRAEHRKTLGHLNEVVRAARAAIVYVDTEAKVI